MHSSNYKQLLLSRINKTASGCWLWNAGQDSYGYGRIRYRGRSYGSHRAAYEEFKGPIPEGMLVCHRCDTPLCINPDHLFLGTHADNAFDMKCKRRSTAGVLNPRAKLTEKQVIDIRRRKARGERTNDIAARYNINRHTVARIATRRNWKEI